MVDEDEAIKPLIQEDEAAESASPTAFIWALTFAAGISGLLFGYEYAYFHFLSKCQKC